MKRLATVEVEDCDFCGGESGWRKCLGCGKYGCSDCNKKGIMNEYGTSVYGGCHYYTCQTCDPKMRTGVIKNELFDALLVVHGLRLQAEGFQASFEPKRKAAEKEADRYREQYSKEGY
jgi:hypothetical protein